MARTLKRQRARARVLQDARSALVSTPTTHEKLWTKVEDLLIGLLDVEIDNSTSDLDDMCPKSVRLVARLDLVRGTAHGKVETVLQRVMGALGVLCVLAEDVYAHSEEFWTRLVVSQMLVSSPWDAGADAVKIREVVAFNRAHGLHLVLRWQDREFQSFAADAIGTFLQAPRHRYRPNPSLHPTEDSTRLVHIGLQFVDCKLAPYDLVRVMEALAVPQLTSESDWEDVPLCGAYALASLEFESVALGVSSLNALSAGLASPHTRRVDNLGLDGAVQLARSPKYVPALKRVLVAALQSKHTDAGTTCAGLKLSLASNGMIQPVHIEALQEALAVATRPLSALSVAGIPGEDVGTWLRLGQIFFTPPRIPTVDGTCELDMSYIARERDAVETLSLSLANLMAETFPRVSAALQASIAVHCRVFTASHGLSQHEEFQVVSVRTSGLSLSGWVLLSTPSAAETSTWVSSSSITSIRIGDDVVVGSRFTHLVVNADSSQGANNEAVLSLARLLGFGLRQLTCGKRDSLHLFLANIMDACPNVQVLSLPDTNVYEYQTVTAWSWAGRHRNIQAVCLNESYLSMASVTKLLSLLRDSQDHTMRYLDLRVRGELETATLDVLLELLKVNTRLVRVHINTSFMDDNYPETVELRSRLDAIENFLWVEYLSPGIQMGFLSVMRRREDIYLDEGIVRKIFQYTGFRRRRTVRW